MPRHLRHLFWNSADAQLNVETSATYIAPRLLSSSDLEGLAWGAANLPGDAWRSAASARGTDPRARALALNLARAADEHP